ncbi:alpha-L-rhamnosidase [Devosia sp.]|uniref:alpha-L-rhamnosidase n=1 Tax=Devosia sp. TaxID=1871048 RepID=UPI0025D988BC|nr:alpha-L-rhamnosidase [Devosia sp.]MCR6634473.1 glycoside hydrolase family 78 protein [Devosia sp.]
MTLPRSAANPFARPDGWTARMIHPLSDQGVGRAGSFVSTSFELADVQGSETLFVTAWGLYRASINGRRVGAEVLSPGWTNYDARLAIQEYAVADLLKPGTNVIEISLGDGWFRSPLMWTGNGLANIWGEKIGAFAELRRAPEGQVLLASDGTWRSGETAVRKSGIYFGETYDARVRSAETHGVEVVDFDQRVLVAQECAPVQELQALQSIHSWRDAEGRTVYDFGQNIGGYIAFAGHGDAGASVLFEHAEILDKDGNFYNVNFRSAEAVVEYTFAGQGTETYRPTFTFQGFRYARATISGTATIDAIEAIPITSVPNPTASFTSANPLVDRLVQNTIWSQRGNFIDIPTDCPQRDERLGWTGDAQVFAPTACFLADSHAFLAKFVREMIVDQDPDGAIAHVSPNPLRLKRPPDGSTFSGSTGWGDAISVIPWTLFTHYADRAILEEAFSAMKRWNDYVWAISDGPIVRPPSGWGVKGFSFGDWLQPQNDHLKAVPTMGDDAAATIYLYISSAQIARIAETIGRPEEARYFAARAEVVKAAFACEFITPAGRLLYDDQSSYALAFLHDLIPEQHIEAAKKWFKATIARARGRIGTGFIGTPALLPALVKIGEPELAASVFLQEEVPGWLAQVKRGATTIWERWDGIKADGSIFEPTMNSYNHYAYGAVCQWLFEAVAGFRPDPEAPGFERVVFEPIIIPSLSPVSAHHDSVAGRVAADWAIEGDTVTYTFTVPDRSEGKLVLSDRYFEISVDGRPLAAIEGGKARCQVAPGTHTARFRINWHA